MGEIDYCVLINLNHKFVLKVPCKYFSFMLNANWRIVLILNHWCVTGNLIYYMKALITKYHSNPKTKVLIIHLQLTSTE